MSLQTRINAMLVSLKDTGLTRLFSARREFPTEWYAFLNAPAGTDQVLTLNLSRDRFPYFASVAPSLKIKEVELVADTSLASINGILAVPALNTPPLKFTLDYSAGTKDGGVWTITNPNANTPLTAAQINDLTVIVHYQVSLV